MTLITLPPATYTLREAARLLSVSDKHVYKLWHRGELEVERDVTGQLRVSREEVYRFIKNRDED